MKREAEVEEIKRAYRQLALKNHPDKNPGDAEAEKRFKEAAEAYEVLSDQAKRQRYDRYGHAGLEGAGVHDFRNAEDIMSAFSDIFGGGLFGDLFDQRRRGPRPGQDLLMKLEIELIEAARGTTKPVELNRNELCTDCRGSGAKKGTVATTCNYCGGQGQVVQSRGFFQVATTCPACGGEGTRITDPCPGCRGRAASPTRSTSRSTSPRASRPGCGSSSATRGSRATSAAPRGNLRIQIQVKQHPFFERVQNDLIARCRSASRRRRWGPRSRCRRSTGPTGSWSPAARRAARSSSSRAAACPTSTAGAAATSWSRSSSRRPSTLAPPGGGAPRAGRDRARAGQPQAQELLREAPRLLHRGRSPRGRATSDPARRSGPAFARD